MIKSTGLYLKRYPSKAKAKQVAKGLRTGRIPISTFTRALPWSRCYAHVDKMPDGQWGVYIKRKAR